jgi:hypothetical protein
MTARQVSHDSVIVFMLTIIVLGFGSESLWILENPQ